MLSVYVDDRVRHLCLLVASTAIPGHRYQFITLRRSYRKLRWASFSFFIYNEEIESLSGMDRVLRVMVTYVLFLANLQVAYKRRWSTGAMDR